MRAKNLRTKPFLSLSLSLCKEVFAKRTLQRGGLIAPSRTPLKADHRLTSLPSVVSSVYSMFLYLYSASLYLYEYMHINESMVMFTWFSCFYSYIFIYSVMNIMIRVLIWEIQVLVSSNYSIQHCEYDFLEICSELEWLGIVSKLCRTLHVRANA